MSNLCENWLFVTSFRGDYEAIDNFIKAAKDLITGEALSFEKFCPCPDKLDASERSDDEKLLYVEKRATDFCCESKLVIREDTVIQYSFVSKNAPPTQWLRNVALLFPELYFVLKYEEFSNNIAGVCQVCNDKFIDHGIDFS